MEPPTGTSARHSIFWYRVDGHDDLRRILTDYGFIGHPFQAISSHFRTCGKVLRPRLQARDLPASNHRAAR